MAKRGALGERIWTAAQALVGTRFRLHGRDAAGGLDCVGLVVLALRRAGVRLGPVPDRYAQRGGEEAVLRGWLAGAGLVPVADWQTGDVLFSAMGRGQWHVMVGGRGKGESGDESGDAVIHAHAGLRRVVMTPGAVPGALAGCWRAVDY
jgi:cell wall-associated NlpC family hydrolase